MAKGKKTVIKEIKKISDSELLINGKEYIIIETTKDIEKATTMKISSNGNRILRFEEEGKKARIDVKRNIIISKYFFSDPIRAKVFSRGYDKKIVTKNDTVDEIGKVVSYTEARNMIATYTSKDAENYDANSGKTSFYISEEVL